MNRWFSLPLLIALVSPVASTTDPRPPDWAAVASAARAYQADPGSAAARRLQEALPNPPAPPPHGVAELLWSLIDTIQRRGAAGNAAAIQLGFRLQDFSDAAFSEDLAVCLGSIATVQPTAFLTTLAAVRASRDPASDPLDVVAWFDPDLSESQRTAELQSRLKAFRSVRDPRLRVIRDACIARLVAIPPENP